MLGQIREHMEVVGSDDQAVGTVEQVAGDRIILIKVEAEGGGRHSLSCSDIDRVEGDRVILDRSADEARSALAQRKPRAARCSSARTRAKWVRGRSVEAFEGTYR